MSELKPCPFCGGEAEMRHWKAARKYNGIHEEIYPYQVVCKKCKTRVGESSLKDITLTEKDAVDLWNNRFADVGKSNTQKKNDVKCIECEYLELELPYGVCSKAYKGMVSPDDSCGKGKRITK